MRIGVLRPFVFIGAILPTQFWELDNLKHDNQQVHGSDYDVLADKASTQAVGALKAHGAGVLAIPAAASDSVKSTSFEVVANGSGVLVSEGAALVDGDLGLTFVFTDGERQILGSLTPNSNQNYIFAEMVIAESVANPDSQRTGLVNFRCLHTSTTPPNSLLLAQVPVDNVGNVGAIIDRRSWAGIEAVRLLLIAQKQRIDALESVVGYPWDVGTLGTIKAWLQRLSGETEEGEEGETPTIITLLSQLNFNSAHPVRADSYIESLIESKIAALRDELLNGATRPQRTREDQLMLKVAINRQENIRLSLILRELVSRLEIDMDVPINMTRAAAADVVGYADGSEIYGDGTGGFPDFVGATDCIINQDGTIEP